MTNPQPKPKPLTPDPTSPAYCSLCHGTRAAGRSSGYVCRRCDGGR